MNSFRPLSRLLSLLGASVAFALLPLAAHGAADAKSDGGNVTVTGEVLDMACYLDHGAHGAKHASCANKCIASGLPVGLKSADGTVYLLIGEHKPINEELASSGGKTITVQGKLVTRDGINLLENVEVSKT